LESLGRVEMLKKPTKELDKLATAAKRKERVSILLI